MMRTRRKQLGFSQSWLAEKLDGISFQQVQKYEKGSNRVSASMLFMAARVLEVPVGYFFEGLETAKGDARAAETVHAAIAALGDFPALLDVRWLTTEQRAAVGLMIDGLVAASRAKATKKAA